MLDAMRKRASSWFVRALLVVLIASFAVWGIGDLFIGRQNIEVVATVGDAEISVRDLDRTFENDRRAFEEQLGTRLGRREAASLGLLNRSLQNLVARKLVDQHRRDLGIGVADAEVAAAIRDDPTFTSAGRFDRMRFDTFLRSAGMSEAGYVEVVREDIGRNRILAAFRSLTTVPAPLEERLGLYRGETRAGTVLVVRREAMAVGEPREGDLTAVLEENQDQFTAPEYRDVTLVTLTTEDLVDEIEIDEAELREAYEARRDFYTTPERRRAGQLLADDQAVIEAAAEALEEGAVFAELAERMADDGLAYSTLGPTTAAELPEEFADAIFALEEGAVSEPVESVFGWHLFRVIEVEPATVTPFAEMREEIRRELALDRALDQLPDLAAALDDGIAAGETLDDAAAAVGIEPRHFSAIDAEGRGPDGEPVEGGAPSQEILQAIFTAPVGETSLLEETPAGDFYMYRVDAVEAPRPRRLEEVRDEVAALWRREAQGAAAAERAGRLLLDARAGRTLEAIAAEAGDAVTLRSFGALTRDASGRAMDLTPAAVATLFATAPGELAAEVVPTAAGQALLRTDEVAAPAPEAMAAIAEQLAAGIENDILSQYEAALRQRYNVDINEAALASLFPEEMP